ncbi:MAG: DUF4190 domain-containing protein [Rhodopirellula sp.]|nr:DUF4190 domain-containing protein [Rhodopirellula sp.]
MIQTDQSHAHLSEQPEEEIEQYRPVSGLAIAALVFGLLALAAWIEPFLVFVGGIGLFVGFAAMWQIARNAPDMLGRKAALIGLFLSTVSLVGVVSQGYTHRILVRKEAQHFARQWFDFTLGNQPQKAFAMTIDATTEPEPVMVEGSLRTPPGESETPPAQRYAERPDIRALVELGDRAQARYYQTEAQKQTSDADEVSQVFAVTYDKDRVKTTFFVRLTMERSIDAKARKAYWQIKSSEAGIQPIALGGESDA